MSSFKVNRLELAPLIISVCAFCLLHPWFVWGMDNYVRFGVFPALYLFAIIPNMSFKENNFAWLFMLFSGMLILLCLIQGYNLSYSLSIISLCVVPFLKKNVFQKSLKNFEIILAVFLGGAVIFSLFLLVGIPVPGHYIAPLNEEFYMGYTVYPPFLVIKNGFIEYFRLCGPFDEPGVVGTVSLFIMYIERYNLRKWPNLLIFIAAIFSFSFMFMTGSILYIIFAFVKKPSTAITLVLLIAFFYTVTNDNPFLQQAVYDRFEWQADQGKFDGDKRFGEAQKDYLTSIIGTSDFFWGDHGKSKGEFIGARSFIDSIISYGFVFCFLYVVWFVVYARMRKMTLYHIFIFLTILLLNLYQRPNFINYSYIFLYTAFIISWCHDERCEKLLQNIK